METGQLVPSAVYIMIPTGLGTGNLAAAICASLYVGLRATFRIKGRICLKAQVCGGWSSPTMVRICRHGKASPV